MSKADHPVDSVQWVPIEKVNANNYNMNSVAFNEMRLLYVSIKQDGFTMPIVTIYNAETDQYVIVDGFHRYTTAIRNKDILASTDGCVPVVVINKPINELMASTIRHNRARGKHAVAGMANVVFKMLDNGWTDEDICERVGTTAEELLRLKHVTGFSKLFENVEYKKAWQTKQQIEIARRSKNAA